MSDDATIAAVVAAIALVLYAATRVMTWAMSALVRIFIGALAVVLP